MREIKYITIEPSERTVKDVLSKIKRELGKPIRLYSYTGLISLLGNKKILELRTSLSENGLLIKVEGPEFLLEEVRKYFVDGPSLI